MFFHFFQTSFIFVSDVIRELYKKQKISESNIIDSVCFQNRMKTKKKKDQSHNVFFFKFYLVIKL